MVYRAPCRVLNHSRHAHSAAPSCAARASSPMLGRHPHPGPRRGLEAAQRGVTPHREMLRYATLVSPLTRAGAPAHSAHARNGAALAAVSANCSSAYILQPEPESASSSSRPSWAADGMPIATSLSGCSLPPAHRARRPRSAPQPPPAGARALGGEWLPPPALTPPSGPTRMPMRIPGSTDTRDWLCSGRKNVNHPFPHFVALRL